MQVWSFLPPSKPHSLLARVYYKPASSYLCAFSFLACLQNTPLALVPVNSLQFSDDVSEFQASQLACQLTASLKLPFAFLKS